ncbi:uncharacterized protein LOC111247065 [Varroa destructor]|uniref:Uncharacterized protein n=1 Tax=Varroa destructor TaxID=109461 RepID=A0A7M7JKI9_VARDE|nr:uncharacterized protein LOC111247065 [Varroa destructor]
MKLTSQLLVFVTCVVVILGQKVLDELFDFDQYKNLKFYVTHRGGLIVPGKVIRRKDASCVTTSIEENREKGNFTYIVELMEQNQAARVTHPAYPLEDGFAFVALSGDTITVKVIGTDYSNYSIVTYNFGERSYHIVMVANWMANSIVRQRFFEITGRALASLEVIDNRGCQRT